jgi:heme-degrading monooxygenase HmoA
MLARIARYEVDPERCDDAVRAFQESAREIADFAGLHSGYICVDSESGAVITVTFWEDQQSLDASEVHAAAARQRAIREVDGDVLAVQVYDVVRDFAG